MWTGLMVPSNMRARHQVAPQEADEAVSDIDAVRFDPDPTSKSGRSVRVIGYSHSRRAVLRGVLVHRDEAGYWGANVWGSRRAGRRRDEKGEERARGRGEDARA